MGIEKLLIKVAAECVKEGKTRLVTNNSTGEQFILDETGEVTYVGFTQLRDLSRIKVHPLFPKKTDHKGTQIRTLENTTYLFEKGKHVGRIDRSEKPYVIRDAKGFVAYIL